MPDHEVFPNPVVKTVAFEVRFPNLFFMETRIGDFQVKVMKDFPQSELVHRRSVVFWAGSDPQELAKQPTGESVDRIWQFKSASGATKLEISTKNLVLSSEQHRSYKYGGEDSFRAIINRVVNHFVALVQIPVALRVGFRYINECPIFNRSTEYFNQCYNSILPMSRFRLEDVVNMDCGVVTNLEKCQFRHLESMKLTADGGQLMLDLDAWTQNIPSDQVMAAADILYETIALDFRNTVKEPIIEYMRKPKGAN
ncbi:MAG TPA: TIGR04255 family protein [Candidatus Acidoferrum sp.]